ncbi:MAG TPA: hypothetical protein PLP58_17275 [Prosthecobacter sp.]|nr:hypothetical protein [Prosthecobacter sp.]
MKPPLALTLLALLLLLPCCSAWQKQTGLTPGQTLILAAKTQAEYERLRDLNETSAKSVQDVLPGTDGTPPGAQPWWFGLLGL